MHTETVTIYKYDELPDESAKERARNWWRDCERQDSHYHESVIEDAECIAELLGIDFKQRTYQTIGGYTRHEPCVFWSGFSSQGDGASFEGLFRYKAGCVAAVKKYAPQDKRLQAIAQDIQAAARICGWRLEAVVTKSGRYEHSGYMDVEASTWGYDDYKYPVTDAAQDAIKQALRSFADWIYRQLEEAYEHAMADENVVETSAATITNSRKMAGSHDETDP